jgi:hypothetical protein
MSESVAEPTKTADRDRLNRPSRFRSADAGRVLPEVPGDEIVVSALVADGFVGIGARDAALRREEVLS